MSKTRAASGFKLYVMVYSVTAILCLRSPFVRADQLGAKPLSIPPSQFWDGNDGLWSTFHVQVGTPAQTVRLLPGTSSSAGTSTWVVIPQGCNDVNPGRANCDNDRGSIFTSNASSTWSTQRLTNDGLFSLETLEEGFLGLSGNAYYGFDVLTLGVLGSGLPSLPDQLIAGIATNSFWLGSLGLSPIRFNFTDFDDPIPSMMGTLRNQSIIPSSSWSYTAGAFYTNPPSFGSLTLSGYDTTQFVAQNSSISFSFGADLSRDLLVSLTSVTYNTLGSSPLLAQKIDIFIDSLVSEIWLPVSACQAFEAAFGLVWNATAELYLVNDTTHNALLAQNPTFTFNLGQSGSDDQGSGGVSITLPYAAFDLNMTEPTFTTPTCYFPLKQAQNTTQYTLGRVFLQEAYIIADYDRRNFSIHQAAFPATSVAQNIVSIEAPGEEDPPTHLSPGVLAGIVVASVISVCLVALLTWFLVKRQRKQRKSAAGSFDGLVEKQGRVHSDAKTGLMEDNDATGIHELDERQAIRPELEAHDSYMKRHELEQKLMVHEIGGPAVDAVELEAPFK